MERKIKAKSEVKSRKMEKSEKDSCGDMKCPFHGKLKTRGRAFKGYVVKKFPKRVVIEFERVVPVRKYERYEKRKIKIHARLPKCIEHNINIGDYVLAKECRPLSKIIHFVILNKIGKSEKKSL